MDKNTGKIQLKIWMGIYLREYWLMINNIYDTFQHNFDSNGHLNIVRGRFSSLWQICRIFFQPRSDPCRQKLQLAVCLTIHLVNLKNEYNQWDCCLLHLPLCSLLDAARAPRVVWQESFAHLLSKPTAPNHHWGLVSMLTVTMTDLMLFQSRTKNLSPSSSAVIVKRRWIGTRRSPTPATVYLAIDL